MPRFARYLGVDYSGAETPTSGLKGLRVFTADGSGQPAEEMRPPPLGAGCPGSLVVVESLMSVLVS